MSTAASTPAAIAANIWIQSFGSCASAGTFCCKWRSIKLLRSYTSRLSLLTGKLSTTTRTDALRAGSFSPFEPLVAKRKREPEPDNQHVWSAIEDLLVSCPTTKLGIQKREKTFRPLLKRFMDTHPEHFADKHPGAVPLLLAAFVYRNKSLKDLDLHRFQALSGDQVVELVKGAVAHNEAVYKTAAKDLKVLDVSFNPMLTPDDIARIVEVTALDELIIWNNPGLSQKSVAEIANGRIAKVTTRAGFLAPLERLATSSYRTKKSLVPFDPPPPFISPTQKMRIRQVMWMTLGTIEVNPSGSQPDLAGQLQIPKGKLSLEGLDVDTLVVLLHPSYSDTVYGYKEENKAFAQLVALPCHDAWVPLAEFYTSIARFEKFMSNKWFINKGCDSFMDRWPLAFPLMLAMGNEKLDYVVSSAFPTEAFDLTTRETLGGRIGEFDSLLMRGPYPIIHGEHTLIFLREPDHGRLRLGLVTRTSTGQLTVLDPAAAALAAGDEKATRAWQRGIGALSPWTGEKSVEKEEKLRWPDRYRRDTMLLNEAAVEKMLAAAAQLSTDRSKIQEKIWDVRNARDEKKWKITSEDAPK
ncbi:hypothetical protein F4679DRAFT_592650 [Xylaria curta]|nr:hypothetical protein F4679DRAFT_592650 [Xylaria curta]